MAKGKRSLNIKAFGITYNIVVDNDMLSQHYALLYASSKLEALNALLNTGINIFNIIEISRVRFKERKYILLWVAQGVQQERLHRFVSSLKEKNSPKEDQKENESD